jgi:hypothetical protein
MLLLVKDTSIALVVYVSRVLKDGRMAFTLWVGKHIVHVVGDGFQGIATLFVVAVIGTWVAVREAANERSEGWNGSSEDGEAVLNCGPD